MPPAFKSVPIVGKSDAASLPDILDQLSASLRRGPSPDYGDGDAPTKGSTESEGAVDWLIGGPGRRP